MVQPAVLEDGITVNGLFGYAICGQHWNDTIVDVVGGGESKPTIRH